MHVLRAVGWLIAVVYSTIPALWLIVHPRARRIGRARTPLTIVGPVWLGLWLLIGALTWPWRHVLAYDTQWTWLSAVPLFAAGLYLYRESFHDFTVNQVLGRSELHPDRHEQRLVTTGIRQNVRHPIYLAHLLELLGWSIGTGVVVIYGMTLLALISGAFMLRSEDRELQQRFGAEYRAYQQRVPAIFPRLWPR